MFSLGDQTFERLCIEEDHEIHNTVPVKDENEKKKVMQNKNV